MSDPVLTADRVGKRYVITHQADGAGVDESPSTIVAQARSFARRWGRRGARPRWPSREDFWALRNVSFAVTQGEVVGIIGRNGAGKSTLLKLISRITEPSEGSIMIRGRVASLIEVGTGFHPDLTGRENVYLNGAILGMRSAEIRRRFDAIVAFAEVDRFLDTPLKRYSSGMYVRLAFAVAAHLDPEILIVDEVLAVGDAAFQRKCLGTLAAAAQRGCTILFVSHNMSLVRTLCGRGILIDGGSVICDTSAGEAVSAYLRGLEGAGATDLLARTERHGAGRARLTRLEVRTPDGGGETGQIEAGRPVTFIFHASTTLPGISCTFTIYDQLGQPITYFDSTLRAAADATDDDPPPRFVCEVRELLLIPGRYRLNVALLCDGELEDHVEGAATLTVHAGASGLRPPNDQPGYGSVFMHHRWTRPI